MDHGGQNNALTPSPNPHLYVHNVPKDSNENELRTLFGQYGQVIDVRLKINQKVGPHAVYAFVTFNSTQEAEIALKNLQRRDIRGRSLRIEFQRSQQRGRGEGGVANEVPGTVMSPKRMRFDEPPQMLPPPPLKVEGFARLVPADDLDALVNGLKRILILQRPDLLESLEAIKMKWNNAISCRWPVSHLSSSQQRLANDGSLVLDTDSNRWTVRISEIIDLN